MIKIDERKTWYLHNIILRIIACVKLPLERKDHFSVFSPSLDVDEVAVLAGVDQCDAAPVGRVGILRKEREQKT